MLTQRYEYAPQPGDFFLSQIRGFGGFWIRFGQMLAGDASRYTHAGILLDDGTVVQAEPGGATIVPLSEVGGNMVLAFSNYTLTDDERVAIVAAARTFEGVPYSFFDYFSLALATLHIRPKWVVRRIRRKRNMICSQLVDQAYLAGGVHLFNDERISGDVTPGDLAHVGTIYHAYTGPWYETTPS